MLVLCLNHYGIYDDLSISLPLHQLENKAYYHHPCGYQSAPSPLFSMSYNEINNLLSLPLNISNEHLIQEIFRYAAFFGIITEVVVSPLHIEWKYNCFHQRDLFFAQLRMYIREQNKISSPF